MINELRLPQRLAAEIQTAQDVLAPLGVAVSIWGGSRVMPETTYYNAARETARLLSAQGYSIITGGGPGVMRAANEGARLGKNGKSVGLVITLPFEEMANEHLDTTLTFEHLASRKVTFCRHSQAFVLFPGGAGTLDELFEVLCLLATEKMPYAPVLLYGSLFWSGLVDWLRETVARQGLINATFLRSLLIVDHPQDVLHLIRTLADEPAPLPTANNAPVQEIAPAGKLSIIERAAAKRSSSSGLPLEP